MDNQEVKGRKVAIDIVKANIFAVVIMVVAAIVFLVLFFWIWAGKKPISELLGGFGDWSITFILVIVGIVVHELIHGITWACYAKSGWKSISFGVMWKLLTPYCHCDEPMYRSPLCGADFLLRSASEYLEVFGRSQLVVQGVAFHDVNWFAEVFEDACFVGGGKV